MSSSSEQADLPQPGPPRRSSLIEDEHQGQLSARALERVEQYKQFVEEHDAPVSKMEYEPFAKDTRRQRRGEASTSSPRDITVPASPTVLSGSSSRRSSTASSSSRAASRPSSPSERQSASGPSSRRSSTSQQHKSSNPPPSISQIKPGGQSWTVDLSVSGEGGNVGTKGTSSPGLKSGSLYRKPLLSTSSSAASSRKSSFNTPVWSSDRRGSGGRGLHETSQPLYYRATTHTQMGTAHGTGDKVSFHERGEKGDAHAGEGKMARQPYLKAHSLERKILEASQAAPEREHAHAHALGQCMAEEQPDHRPPARLGGTTATAITAAAHSFMHAPSMQQQLKSKRQSMPPLQNRGGPNALLSGRVSQSGSRRGSMIQPSTSSSQRDQRVGSDSRNRSKSLPTDSLFVAYSSCALPAVLTSSLANMPVPSQPAIPVTVARRYSFLGDHSQAAENASVSADEEQLPSTSISLSATSSPDGSEHFTSESGMRSGESSTTPSRASISSSISSSAASDGDDVVYENPEVIEGIDTKSILDTSHIQTIEQEGKEEEEEEEDEMAASDEQEESDVDSESMDSVDILSPPRRGEWDESGMMSHQPSPVTSSDESLPQPVLTYPSISPMAATSPPRDEQLPISSLTGAAANVPRRTQARSRSLIHTFATDRRGTARRDGLHATARSHSGSRSPSARTGRDSLMSSPDGTPLTSPTNLAHAAFRTTLLHRRMSDVVAKDIANKLKILKKHMETQSNERQVDREQQRRRNTRRV